MRAATPSEALILTPLICEQGPAARTSHHRDRTENFKWNGHKFYWIDWQQDEERTGASSKELLSRRPRRNRKRITLLLWAMLLLLLLLPFLLLFHLRLLLFSVWPALWPTRLHASLGSPNGWYTEEYIHKHTYLCSNQIVDFSASVIIGCGVLAPIKKNRQPTRSRSCGKLFDFMIYLWASAASVGPNQFLWVINSGPKRPLQRMRLTTLTESY